MENGIYAGVIVYFHAKNHFTFETSVCAALTREEATATFTKHAESFEREHQLKYQARQVLVQRQDEGKVSRELYLARAGMSENESEIADNSADYVM